MRAQIKFVRQLAKETGWNFKFNCVCSSKADTEAERNDFVKELSKIDEKYNTK